MGWLKDLIAKFDRQDWAKMASNEINMIVIRFCSMMSQP
jgi:hypothetical protein